MGFAASLQSLTHLSIKMLPSNLGASTNDSDGLHPGGTPLKPGSFEADGFRLTHSSVPVIRANRTRRRSTTPRISNKPKADTSSAQLPLTMPAKAAAETAPRQLKIVQREPRMQPERLFISGRMADVCAALERMTLDSQAHPA